jgi:hypothetical protein
MLFSRAQTAAVPDAIAPPLPVPTGMWLVAIGVATLAGAWLSRIAAFSAGELSLVWPPAGIAYGALLAFGPRGLLAATAGVVAWAIGHYGTEVLTIVCAVAAALIGPLAGVAAMRHLLGAPSTQARQGSRLRWVLALYAATLAVGAPLAALVGTVGLSLRSSSATGWSRAWACCSSRRRSTHCCVPPSIDA